MKSILRDLASACRVQTSKLLGTQIYRPNHKIQDMLRNLGAFEVALTVLQLESELRGGEDRGANDDDSVKLSEDSEMLGISEDARKENEVEANIRDILVLCNTFLAWFIKHNEKNQELAFVHLETFTQSLSSGIGSSLLIAEIFRGNPLLIKSFPPKLIVQCADLLATEATRPEYLDVLEALVWQPTHDSPNNLDIQHAIIHELTDPVRKDTIIYLCEVSHRQYSVRLNPLICDSLRTTRSYLTNNESSYVWTQPITWKLRFLK